MIWCSHLCSAASTLGCTQQCFRARDKKRTCEQRTGTTCIFPGERKNTKTNNCAASKETSPRVDSAHYDRRTNASDNESIVRLYIVYRQVEQISLHSSNLLTERLLEGKRARQGQASVCAARAQSCRTQTRVDETQHSACGPREVTDLPRCADGNVIPAFRVPLAH